LKIFEGHYNAQGHRYGIVVSRFNQPIVELLLDGAIECLKKHGVADADLAVAWVPGAFEIPGAAHKLASTGRYDAIICVGVVIRGETAHFDYVAGQAASGVLNAGISHGIPILFSVLTTENKEQAEVRAGTKGMNTGFCNALAAIEMVNLYKSLS